MHLDMMPKKYGSKSSPPAPARIVPSPERTMGVVSMMSAPAEKLSLQVLYRQAGEGDSDKRTMGVVDDIRQLTHRQPKKVSLQVLYPQPARGR